jgi:hypothetical protein
MEPEKSKRLEPVGTMDRNLFVFGLDPVLFLPLTHYPYDGFVGAPGHIADLFSTELYDDSDTVFRLLPDAVRKIEDFPGYSAFQILPDDVVNFMKDVAVHLVLLEEKLIDVGGTALTQAINVGFRSSVRDGFFQGDQLTGVRGFPHALGESGGRTGTDFVNQDLLVGVDVSKDAE